MDDNDRQLFLELFARVCTQFNWDCYVYCLMSNHYHIVIETRDGNLSNGMRHLNSVYCQRFNQRHRRVGHVLQGRYSGILVQKECYLLELVRYVILNPVRARMVKTAGQWAWSSYRTMIGKSRVPAWLAKDWLLNQFGSNRLQRQKQFIKFIMEGRLDTDLWGNLRQQMYLGDEQFVERMSQYVDQEENSSEFVREQRCLKPRSIKWYESQCENRNDAIILAIQSGSFTQKELADYFQIHYSSISKILKIARSTLN